MKQVRETAAGKSISAFVILNAAGLDVATVQAHFSDSGICTVDVWDRNNPIQQARAGGGGYDMFTACLSGMTIDGHKLYDGSTNSPELATIMARYKHGELTAVEAETQLRAVGACLSNWSQSENRWLTAHYKDGLDRLKDLGYKVIKAI